jgi:hypothetical protein
MHKPARVSSIGYAPAGEEVDDVVVDIFRRRGSEQFPALDGDTAEFSLEPMPALVRRELLSD